MDIQVLGERKCVEYILTSEYDDFTQQIEEGADVSNHVYYWALVACYGDSAKEMINQITEEIINGK